MFDPNKILFRCSALSEMMTNFDSVELTKGHVTSCKKILRQSVWSRWPTYGNKYTKKGIRQEEAAITLLARYRKIMLKKNTERLKNFFITGLPDVYLGDTIKTALEGFDTKASWDAHTFPEPDVTLDPQYEFQNHGYMYLTGAKKWTTAYTLVNGLPDAILQSKKSLWYNLDCPGEFDDEYIQQCIEIEKNMIFDMEQFQKDNRNFDLTIKLSDWKYDLPINQRVIEKVVMRDEAVISKIADRVNKGRKVMVKHYDMYYKNVA